MAHFPADNATQRPGMRRKSSAQNLLSSFKPGTSSLPQPLNLASGSPVISAFPFTVTATATAIVREGFDTQPAYLDVNLQSPPATQQGQGTSVEYLRDLVQKRIITLTYIRSIHDGRSHWFHTVLVSQAELEKVCNNAAMKKRTYRFAVLGLALSTLLDINQPQDLLRALLNAITEYDQAKEEGDNKSSKMRIKFNKGKNPKKGPSGLAEYYPDNSGDSYLYTPSMPFSLDYHQTLLSLIDVLSEVYNKISKLLGPSPFPHSSQHMMGPLGLLTPQPGVSYLFSGDQTGKLAASTGNSVHGRSNSNSNQLSPGMTNCLLDVDTTNGSLWHIANASNTSHGVTNIPTTSSVTTALGEMVLKIDGKLKKITSTLLKDLDTVARNSIKEELGSLDPVQKDDGPGGTKSVYEFEGI